MKFALMLAAAWAAAGPAWAADARQDAIWTAAHNRMVNQIDVWFDDGDYPRCIQLLRMLNALEPRDMGILTDLGWMLGNVEQGDKELELYRNFRKAHPGVAEAAYPEAQFYFLKRDYARTISILAPTISQRQHPNAYRMLAHSYERTHRLVDAERVWVLYTKLDPKDETAKLNLARVRNKLKAQGGG